MKTSYTLKILRSVPMALRASLWAVFLLALMMESQAGDILRGGAGMNSPSRVAAARAQAGSAQAAQSKANAQDRLARTTKALQSVEAMQKAARALASQADNLGPDPSNPGQRLPNVPNGLRAGGLEVEAGGVWDGASQPTESNGGRGTLVTIRQNKQQALLNWRTFNVGKTTTLKFDQSEGGANKGQWIAFNKVNDPTGRPSQILGQIKADGQVYVINRNGIIFGGTSQINVHALVASSLPINDTLVERGVLNNPDLLYLFTFDETAPPPTFQNRYGDVTVQKGAQLVAPKNEADVGGRIALIGANVTNDGTISTPSGQTILAAGLQVAMDSHNGKYPNFGDRESDDPSLRGLDVYIGALKTPTQAIPVYAGTVTNNGLIDVSRASVLMTGKDVNQRGVIDSSTSVSLNGRIDLIASYGAVRNPNYDAANPNNGLPFLYENSGAVTLGAGSVTRVLPEWQNKATDTSLKLRSQVNMTGLTVRLEKGAIVLAPNAAVSVKAGVWAFTGLAAGQPKSEFIFSNGQIYLDSGALIDVAGTTDVSVSILQNILELELRGQELANSPLQRDSLVRAAKITLDGRKSGYYGGYPWIGTPLGDATGYFSLIQRTVAQYTTGGGDISLQAGSSVVLSKGSTVDVSGGWINYLGAMVKTTRLMYQGRLVDISKATPDRLYDGFYTGTSTKVHTKWGVSKTFAVPLSLSGEHFEQTYLAGADGGNLTINAPSMVLDGDLAGNTVNGPRQLRNTATYSEMPAMSTLTLAFKGQALAANPPFYPVAVNPPKVVFEDGGGSSGSPAFKVDGAGNPAPLTGESLAQVILSPELFTTSGFGHLTVDNSEGDIDILDELDIPAGGSLTLDGANITVKSNVTAPGGALKLTAHNISPFLLDILAAQPAGTYVPPTVAAGRGKFTLDEGAKLSTAGLIVDDRLSSNHPIGWPLVVDGGSVEITGYDVDLKEGSVIDVSGGAAMTARSQLAYGDGGSISILAGRDPKMTEIVGGSLHLGASLLGFSGAVGGSLTVQAQQVRIGNNAAGDDQTLAITPDFFNQGGFSSFTLRGLGRMDAAGNILPAVEVEAGTVIQPTIESLAAVTQLPNGGGLGLRKVMRAIDDRSPVSIALNAGGINALLGNGGLLVRGDVVVGENTLIQTDPLGKISLTGHTVTLLGSLVAPGGSITLSGSSNARATFAGQDEALATVYLGPSASISAAGTFVPTPDPYGRRTGMLLSGGTISISGNIVAERGSKLDVSGSTGVVDLPPAFAAFLAGVVAEKPAVSPRTGLNEPLLAVTTVPVRIDTDGGTVVLKGGQLLFFDGSILGKAGGPTAAGGSLEVSSGRFYTDGTVVPPDDINLVVRNEGSTFAGFLGGGKSAIGRNVLDANGNQIPGMGYFSVKTFLDSGMDSLKLGGNVYFPDAMSITARGKLEVGSGGVIVADSDVKLQAPYVALGMPFQPPILPEELKDIYTTTGGTPYFVSPTFGAGSLTVTANLIDVGNLTLKNIGKASLIAEGGDIRGDGTFNMAGDLLLQAGQVYPASGVSFMIAAFDPNVVVATSSTGSPQVTLASSILPPGFGIGSPLLGSTVAAINGSTVTLAANANATITNPTAAVFAPGAGSVTITGSGDRQLPLSAGGTLGIYASNIDQNGVLRAPLGTINLGWDGTGTAPRNLISGAANFPVTQQVNLGSGSITSVSAVDSKTGETLLIPYGISLDGNSWIDPAGVDITASGVPSKNITVSGLNLSVSDNALLDISGGGDLFAYRWISGVDGTRDILASDSSYAIIPGYSANYAPYAPFNSSTAAGENLGEEAPGYVNDTIGVGDQIYLDGSNGLPSGIYTLLPARYALLPGAFLVSKYGEPMGPAVTMPDGSNIVSGYMLNSLNKNVSAPNVLESFEVLSPEVVQSRAKYEVFFANTFLEDSAKSLNATVPRLPKDGGHLILQASQSMTLEGNVRAQGLEGARGGLVDIASPLDIVIASNTTPIAGKLVLDAGKLSGFGAESLLIGGVRTIGTAGTTVTVSTNNLLVDNAGSTLTAPEIILVAKQNLTLAANSEIEQSGALAAGADTLLLGSSTVAGSGDGVLVRLSGDPTAAIARSGVSSSTVPTLVVDAGARIAGKSVTLDSTSGTTIDPTADVDADYITLNSGRISLQLNSPGALQANPGLVLTGGALQDLFASAGLSLLSYSTLDIYGTGTLTASGRLALRAAEMRGFNNGGGLVSINASQLLLDNGPQRTGPGAVAGNSGTLEFNVDALEIGTGQLNIDQYANVNMNIGTGGMTFTGTGGVRAGGAMNVVTPFIVTGNQATQSLAAAGALNIVAPMGGAITPTPSTLGASLTLEGASIVSDTNIFLPSGLLTMHATTGNIDVGGTIFVGGTRKSFYDLTKFTSAGSVTLKADGGSINVAAGSEINISADPGGGDAGALIIATPQGGFSLAGSLLATGSATGKNGSFSLDVGNLASLSAINDVLNSASFDEIRNFRVRNGDVLIDGLAKSHVFAVSADGGAITVTGTIDASGEKGGTIALRAKGSVVLENGALLDASGQDFDNAGKGGAVFLEAGAAINGVSDAAAVVDIKTGSTIDLRVASKNAQSASMGEFSGTLHLRAPQNAAYTDLQVNAINGTILDASSIMIEGYRIYDLTNYGGVIGGATQAQILADGKAFLGADGTTTAQYTAISDRLLANQLDPNFRDKVVIAPGVELINAGATTSENFALSAGALTVNPANGGSITFPPLAGPPNGNTITISVSGKLTSSSGVVTTLAAGTYAVPYGSTLTLDSTGTITANATIPVRLAPSNSTTSAAAAYSTASGAASSTTISVRGSSVTLTTANINTGSGINLAAGSMVTLPLGTPGNNTVRATSSGTIFLPNGTTTTFAANTNFTVTAGSSVRLDAAGTLRFASGSGGPVTVALASGSFTTVNATTITPQTGSIFLGSATSTEADDWSLAGNRFGPKGAPGVLTIRSAGNIVFYNALSDGFASAAYNAALLNQNTRVPVNTQSWSYRLVAGADLGAADFRQVRTPDSLADSAGSILIGKNNGTNVANSNGSAIPSGSPALTSASVVNRFQTIRTGSGNIDIAAGRDVQLLNQFSTIYTAGTKVIDPTMGGTFDVPILDSTGALSTLGANQQPNPYAVQYSMAGGNVSIYAQNDIARYTRSTLGQLIADSERQLPVNWLYRRGFVNSQGFGVGHSGDIQSTSWWVDFSNFFEGVATLGGGNLSMVAGRDVSNVDGAVATNARVTKGDPDTATMVELGGGDLLVKSGRDIDAGVYYVERGEGTLAAGGSIKTNSTRTPSKNTIIVPSEVLAPEVWLPTTLFLGKGSFDVSARGDVLLGPVGNAFLLPEGYSNTFWYKTYFSTYDATSSVSVTSTGGDVTLRTGATQPSSAAMTPLLQIWLQRVLALTNSSVSFYQPWLRLNEQSVAPFSTMSSIMPGTLKATSFAGDINLAGDITLAPSPTGTLELLADGSINGLQPTGLDTTTATRAWSSSTINVSDADPASVPSVLAPFAYQSFAGLSPVAARATDQTFFQNFDKIFDESGSTTGTHAVLQTKQALHTPGVLHANDAEPVRLYSGGEISGLTLFSPKFSQILAEGDISDIAFYLQNANDDDVTVVSSGGDMVLYNANTPLRVAARAAGNSVNSATLSGDIQIAGEGSLQVMAGGDLDLGTGGTNADGTGTGITSVGNARNPYLGFDGANITVAAGLRDGEIKAEEFLSEFGGDLQSDATTTEEMSEFEQAMQAFFTILRDAGRGVTPGAVAEGGAEEDTGTVAGPTSTDTDAQYAAGFEAIDALFGGSSGKGDVLTRSRDIRTKSGGDIFILIPNGSLTMADSNVAETFTPPGIVTESGGRISIFADGDVSLGIGRIFTLRGGDIVIWSSTKDIKAGNASKTVQSAPPTRVLIDPQSGDVQTDLAGLSTGGGIGVLATVAGVEPGTVDLIAPVGVVDAGDAGIRATGAVNIAATKVLNASSISAPKTSGVPTTAPPAAPNVAGLTSAATTGGAGARSASNAAEQVRQAPPPVQPDSLFSVQVVGYGGGDTQAPANDGGIQPMPAPAPNPDIPNPNVRPAPPSQKPDEDDEKKKKQGNDGQQGLAEISNQAISNEHL